jgi:hypothetical protein
MKRSYKIVLIAASTIGLAGILFGLYMYNLEPKDLQKVRPDYVITAADLLKAFESDENAASINYIGKVVEVSGILQSIKSGENNALSIVLKTGSDFSSVICTLEGNQNPSDFITGKQITIRGECSGFLMDVLLNNCSVIKK